jgi:murein DD-endopeptidase MepM/ murein hydrolase activator NlpD
MLQYTVILMPDGADAVRRFRVRVSSPRKVAGIALGVVLTLAAITADWVRLRLEAVDQRQLRAQLVAQRERLRGYTDQLRVYSEKVGEAEAQLAQVREFERKVRVIANLPAGSPEPRSSAAAPLLGVGGGADDPARATPPQAAAPDDVSSAAPPPDSVPWERIQARAETLARRALEQQGSLRSLIEQIRAKTDLLASTPSIWPAHGWVTSTYGYRISPFTGLRDFHAGIDISAEPGTEIVAPARGRVAFVGSMGALGNAVVLDHGHGIRTTFGHAKALLVQPGQSVERGQKIALVGSSGRSTGPHVHYAVERDGRLTNPIDYIVE